MNVKFLVLCCVVRGIFQVPQAVFGESIVHHTLPEDAFKLPTCSVVISQASMCYVRYLHALSRKLKNQKVKQMIQQNYKG